jgi:hypothetical protein
MAALTLSSPAAIATLSESLTVTIDAPPATVRVALRRLDLLTPVRRALDALGLGDRAAFDGAGGLVWDERLHARWDMCIDDAGDDRSRLTVVTRFAGDDLHHAWPLAGPLADAWARRAARAVKASAEAQSSS